uniref:Uncharacterized protein n=1 Tax=Pipistrellus kuhlii TaxID=59472 RepID=A0A7J8B1E7_PIPKU|nr:hypothetical protein mPipKuh1_007822 [Pipistrellus kuhlii]
MTHLTHKATLPTQGSSENEETRKQITNERNRGEQTTGHRVKTTVISFSKILSLSFAFGILIMMCLGVVLFGFLLFGILCASWICKTISFTRWGKFSVIISSNRFSVSCSLSSSGTPIILMLVCLKLSQRLLTQVLQTVCSQK